MTATDLDQPAPRPEAPSSVAPDAAAEAEPRPTPNSRATLTVGEAACIGGLLLVASVGSVALFLAQIGQHDGWLSVVVGTLLAALLAGVAVVAGGRPSVEIDKTEIGLVVATLIAAGFFFLPGYPYAYGDKDPGAYVTHGFAIARDGDVAIADDVKASGLANAATSGGSFPGVYPAYEDADASTSQFFHYTSALMATADDIAGPRGLFNMTPLLAMLSVAVFVIAARRAAGTRVAIVVAPLLIVGMMQVWQAKYPSTEIPAQLFLSGALLAGVLAVDRRWVGGAFVAGVLTGLSFLVRPDGFLYIMLLAGVAAAAIAVGRVDGRLVAAGAGVVVMLPGAFWNAYQLRAPYTEVNGVPSPTMLVAACIGLLVIGWSVHRLWRWRRFTSSPMDLVRRWQRPLAIAAAALFGLTLLALWNRTTLFGRPYWYNAFSDATEPSLAEFNLRWLSLYVTWPGLVIIWLGLALAMLRHNKTSLYLLLLPGTLVLPLYLWDARVSMRMMWWVRRFVPAVVPAIMLLIAVALVWALWHHNRALRVAGLAALLALLGIFARQSVPLRNHDEMGGSWDMAAAVAAPAGDEEGVFMFERPPAGDVFDPLRNVPLGVWWIFGQTSSWLPFDYDMETIEAYQEAFPDRPLFLVAHELPDSLPQERFEVAAVMQNELIHWEEWPWGIPADGEPAHRPDTQLRSPKGLVIWQVLD